MQYSEVENRDDYHQFSERGVTVWDQAGKMVVYDRAEQRMTALENELFIVGSYYIQRCALKKVKVTGLYSVHTFTIQLHPGGGRCYLIFLCHCSLFGVKVLVRVLPKQVKHLQCNLKYPNTLPQSML